MFLTDEELAQLTDKRRPSAQIRWLKARGWPFEVSAKNRPRVLSAVAQAKMGAMVTAPVQSGPNWEALNGTS